MEQPLRGPAVWQYISDVICVLIEEELNFQVAWPAVAAQCERLQDGSPSLAARWPEAKSAEEPHSLHPRTRMWTKVAGQHPVSLRVLKDALCSVNLKMFDGANKAFYIVISGTIKVHPAHMSLESKDLSSDPWDLRWKSSVSVWTHISRSE